MFKFLSDKSVAENTNVISECTCPPSCRQVAYEATVSGSMLSDTFIHTLMTRSVWPDIEDRYFTALDVHSRVDTDSMMTLRRLVGLGRTYETLTTIIDVDLLNPVTSIVGDIYSAIDRIVQLTDDSVNEFRTQLLQPFTDTYEKKIDFFVVRIVSQGNAFLAHHASSKNGSFTDVDVNNSATIFCQHFVEFWAWFKDDYDDPFRAWTYFDRKICSNDLSDMCKKFLRGKEIEQKKMPEQVKVWLKCMTEFREFLDDVGSWLKAEATLNSSLPLKTTDYDEAMLVKMRNNANHLRNTTENFRLHILTKVRTNWNESCFVRSSEYLLYDYVIHNCIELCVCK